MDMATAKLIEENQELLEMIQQIKDTKRRIRYGDPSDAHGWTNGVQISWVNTGGGMQYKVCRLDSSGREYAGWYLGEDSNATLSRAMQFMRAYTKPSPLTKFLEDKKTASGYPKPVYSWYFQKTLTQIDTRVGFGLTAKELEAFAGKDCETVTLTLPAEGKRA